MTQLDFINGMKKLSTYYLKDLTVEQLTIWYEIFENVREEDFNQAIINVSKKLKHMPSAPMLYLECSKAYKDFLVEVAKYMWDDNYYYNGFEKLKQKQAKLNYEKTNKWIEDGMIPIAIKDDFEYYIQKYKKYRLKNNERLKLEC